MQLNKTETGVSRKSAYIISKEMESVTKNLPHKKTGTNGFILPHR